MRVRSTALISSFVLIVHGEIEMGQKSCRRFEDVDSATIYGRWREDCSQAEPEAYKCAMSQNPFFSVRSLWPSTCLVICASSAPNFFSPSILVSRYHTLILFEFQVNEGTC